MDAQRVCHPLVRLAIVSSPPHTSRGLIHSTAPPFPSSTPATRLRAAPPVRTRGGGARGRRRQHAAELAPAQLLFSAQITASPGGEERKEERRRERRLHLRPRRAGRPRPPSPPARSRLSEEAPAGQDDELERVGWRRPARAGKIAAGELAGPCSRWTKGTASRKEAVDGVEARRGPRVATRRCGRGCPAPARRRDSVLGRGEGRWRRRSELVRASTS